MNVDCPYCGAPDQEVEDLGDNPYFLTGECDDCNKGFSCDDYRSEYYDEKGNVIKEVKHEG